MSLALSRTDARRERLIPEDVVGSLPLHPAIVHVPLGLAFILPVLALASIVLFWKERAPRRAWSIVVALQAVLVASAWAAQRTGAAEEERVEPVVTERALERHEEAAEQFLAVAAGVLVLSTLGLVVPERAARGTLFASAAATVLVTAMAVRVGHAGGELVYRENAGAAYVSGAPTRSDTEQADRRQAEGDRPPRR